MTINVYINEKMRNNFSHKKSCLTAAFLKILGKYYLFPKLFILSAYCFITAIVEESVS